MDYFAIFIRGAVSAVLILALMTIVLVRASASSSEAETEEEAKAHYDELMGRNGEK